MNYAEYALRIVDLEQQLAEREKQIVELRSTCESHYKAAMKNGHALVIAEKQIALLRNVISNAIVMVGHPDNIDYLQEALAATQDLSNYILCDAEPIGWWNGKETAFFEHETDAPVGEYKIPLYKARKP